MGAMSPVCLRISAPAGYGKTALLDALERSWRSDAGNIVFRAAARANVTRGNVDVLHELLKADGARLQSQYAGYVSGLELLFDSTAKAAPERVQLGFLRLVDALSSDHPVLILLDDGQWASESVAAVLESIVALEARKVAVIVAQRTNDRPSARGEVELDLGALDAVAASLLARMHYPNGSESVIDAIARGCGGVPLDIIVLSSQASLNAITESAQLLSSLDETVASAVVGLSAVARKVLEACALLSEPISYGLLSSVFGSSETAAALAELVPRYVMQGDGGLRFAHSLVREAVLKEVAAPAPAQARLLEELRCLDAPASHELRDAFDFALALGDRNLALEMALRQAQLACAQRRWEDAAEAYEKAFATRQTPEARLLEHYIAYINALRLLERREDALDFATRVLERLAPGAAPGIGFLVGLLALVLFSLADYDGARAVCQRYATLVSSQAERDELASLALAQQILRGGLHLIDEPEFNELLEKQTTPSSFSRLHRVRALANLHRGNHEAVLLDLAALTAQPSDDAGLDTAYLFELHRMWQWYDQGTVVRDSLLEGLAAGERSVAWHLGFITLVDFAAGNWELALARVYEYGISRFRGIDLAQVLIPCAAILALGAGDHALAELIDVEAERVLRRQELSPATELLLWCNLRPQNSRLAAPEAHALVDRWAKEQVPLDRVTLGFGPALYAERYPTHFTWSPNKSLTRSESRMNYGNRMLAAGWRERDKELLGKASETFTYLGAKAFADLALKRMYGPREAEHRLPKPVLTTREHEVCLLVAEGLTNRGIAHRLFVSERTVATHVSNAFGKLGVHNRTELALRLTGA